VASDTNRTVIFERNHQTQATLTLSFTLFFDSLDVDDALGGLISKILDLILPHTTWHRTHEHPLNSPVTSETLDHCATLVKDTLHSKTDCFLVFDSGKNRLNAIGTWALKYTSSPSYQGDLLGYLQVHLPVDQNKMKHEQLLNFLNPWLNKINFIHGYSGLSINYDHSIMDKERNLKMRSYCEQHLGVNLSDLVTERRYLLRHLKGAQWLTIIGNKLLGHHQKEAKILKSIKSTTITSQGMLIRACKKPLMGDRHRCEAMSAYKSINRFIAPWLVESLFPMPGFPDRQAVRTWLHKLRPKDI
jgi:hypothetical protein